MAEAPAPVTPAVAAAATFSTFAAETPVPPLPPLAPFPPDAPAPRPSEHNSVFFLCDIQETFRPVFGPTLTALLKPARLLVQAAGALDIPLVVTEQKPFKPTCAELASLLPTVPRVARFDKTRFSMLTDEVLCHLARLAADAGTSERVRHVYLFGIEAHVCVLQTAMDLLRRGHVVYLSADAIASQRAADRDPALERLVRAGAVLTTAESAVYELLGDAKHPKFKAILPFVKEHATAVTAPAQGNM